MRWERFFEDLEHQLDSEWEAERAVLDSEAERLRMSRLTLRDRLAVLAEESDEVAIDLAGPAATLRGPLTGVGADWCSLELGADAHGALVPLRAITAVGAARPALTRSTRPVGAAGITCRMTLGFVLRDAARRRGAVRVHTVAGGAHTGTIDRAGADHFDLALHDADVPRRDTAVAGLRVIPFSTVTWVQLVGIGI
ncbi:hypothetical protein [Microbacterium imperiale]|uniref:Uncharacterized protein n=1 Tax=Microbacterium imperiale TaxID=33884 RepID=A0A9W6M217_9MICO|nr:hypothetical protein [Microbacterium imperiale]MBP2420202.1 hypothetical protein [Microbacterium imperiale]MDS0197935.1 hypothetical protein [Microbacterium imperiale]BFE40543.1 hypothetical protein GCM10017544_14990 [Microbacterium imperiale]GLJ78481.1 hypothetical protein GCM10017586_01630 [Microbacterium imperiale]